MNQVLLHSHIWFSFGWFLNHIFISPAHHQIHHSRAPQHFNKNLGDTFAIWDWLFGTLYLPKGDKNIRTGVSENEQADFDRARDCYVLPAVKARHHFKKREFGRLSHANYLVYQN